MTNIQKFEQAFNKAFPKAWCRVGDWDGSGDLVLWSGEDSWTNDGRMLFDYYSMDGVDVLPEVEALANKFGYYFECYDPGTYIAYKL